MPLTPNQVESIKEQLRQQVESMPEDKKAPALKQIEEMSPETIESLVKQQRSQNSEGEKRSIFRMIVEREIEAIDVGENKYALAVLDINPISKGHIMIIPKKAVDKAKLIPTPCFALAKKISQNIISKLRAKSTEIQTETKFGESIIHVIPIYNESLNINSPRQKAQTDELKSLADKIRIIRKIRIPKIKKQSYQMSNTPAIQMKRRIA